MSLSTEQSLITIPLSRTDQSKARTLADKATSEQELVYRNVLAIQALHHYLKIIGISSDSEHDGGQSLSESSKIISVLYLPEVKGYLECCVVSVKDTCLRPNEIWRNQTRPNRIGYVVVQLDESNTEAAILGFVSEVTVESLLLSSLQPLDDLIDAVWDYVPPPEPDMKPSQPHLGALTRLRQWFKEKIKDRWQPVEELPEWGWVVASGGQTSYEDQKLVDQFLLTLPTEELEGLPVQNTPTNKEKLLHVIQETNNETILFEAIDHLRKIDPETSALGVRRAQDLGIYFTGHAVALMVAIAERKNGKMAVFLRVYSRDKRHLPQNLKLTLLNDIGDIQYEAISRHSDRAVRLRFGVNEGKCFSVKISIDEESVTESFIA